MEKTRLLAVLAQLQQELRETERLDASTRDALESAARDIQRQLDGQEPVSDEQESLSGRLQNTLLGFETEHPELTRLVNQLSAALANLGI